jgi:hypothetical protein
MGIFDRRPLTATSSIGRTQRRSPASLKTAWLIVMRVPYSLLMPSSRAAMFTPSPITV